MASPSETARAAILGVPFDPMKKPDRVMTVKAFEQMDAKVAAVTAGAIIRDSRANLIAVSSAPANQMAWVLGDSTPEYNGVYQNTGTANAPVWTRRGDLPYSIIRMINVGAGTPDAIVATSSLPVPEAAGAAIFTLNIVGTNTGPVTINGKPLRTNSGGEIVPGGLVSDGVYVFVDQGAEYRLLSDYASAAIVSAAEAWANAAQDAKGDAEAAASLAQQRYVRVDVADTVEGDPATDYAAGSDIDGVTLVTGMLVLRASPDGDADDGIYVVPSSGAASRVSQFDEYDDLPGTGIRVMRGVTYGSTEWRVNSEPGGTLGTTTILIEQFEAGGGGGSVDVLFTEDLGKTPAEQAQARENIGIRDFADLAEETDPDAGDWFIIERASDGEKRKVSASNLPGGDRSNPVTLDDLDGQLAFWAHRGDRLLYPEHTIEAYRESVRRGAINLEIDVWLTTDGIPFVMHDSTLGRTTTGTGNTNAQTAVAVSGLAIDAGAFMRGGLLNNYKVPYLEDVIAEFGNRVILHIEAKQAGAGRAIVALLERYSIAKNMALVSAFSPLSDELQSAIEAGYPAIVGYATWAGSPSAASLASAGYFGVFTQATGTTTSNMDLLRAAGLKVYAYTVNRRYEAGQLAGHVDGIYTDDSEYLSGRTPPSTRDPFALARWDRGMLGQNDYDLSDNFRGSFFPGGYWGFAAQPTSTAPYGGIRWVLQGWACPVVEDPINDTFEVEFSATHAADLNDGRWCGIAIMDTSMLDREMYNSASTSPAYEKGYVLFKRRNGEMCIYKSDGTTQTLLDSVSGASFSVGAEQHYRVIITPTTITFQRLNAAGGTATETASANDSDFRGAYIYLGVSTCAGRFRNVKITTA